MIPTPTHPMRATTDRAAAATSSDEAGVARLREIDRLGLLRDGADAQLHAEVRALAGRLDLPVALVSILLEDAQLFLASHGLSGWIDEIQGTPLEWSFCRYTATRPAGFVVEDATTHPLTAENPLVTIDGIGCYAGVPLVSQQGVAFGAVCVIGGAPRTFSSVELEELRATARALVARFEEQARD